MRKKIAIVALCLVALAGIVTLPWSLSIEVAGNFDAKRWRNAFSRPYFNDGDISANQAGCMRRLMLDDLEDRIVSSKWKAGNVITRLGVFQGINLGKNICFAYELGASCRKFLYYAFIKKYPRCTSGCPADWAQVCFNRENGNFAEILVTPSMSLHGPIDQSYEGRKRWATWAKRHRAQE